MEDEYEPAVTDETTGAESGAESAPVVHRSVAAAAETEAKANGPTGDGEPSPDVGPRMPRVWNEKSREMFRNVVKQVQASDAPLIDDDELAPMEHAEPAPAAAPAVAASAPAVAPAPVAATAPAAPPPGLPELPDIPLPGTPPVAATPAAPTTPAGPDPREAQYAAREAALAEREKLAPDRTALIEKPAATFVAWLRDAHGITSDDELRTALSDFVTELSEQSLGVKLPDEVKAGLESRKALRSVRAYKQTLDKDRQTLTEAKVAAEKQAAEARAAQDKQSAETSYVNKIAELIAPAKEQYRFLHDPEVTGGLRAQDIIYEILKEQQRLGYKPDLPGAVEYGNNYYRQLAEKDAKRASYLQSLLTPASAPATAQAAVAKPSPGGAPGPAPTAPAAKPAAKEPEWDPSDLPMDGRTRRQASLQRLVAARKAAVARQ